MPSPATKSKLANLNALQLEYVPLTPTSPPHAASQKYYKRAFEKAFPLSARKAKKAEGMGAVAPDITVHQWAIIKKKERNDKARIRMAKCVQLLNFLYIYITSQVWRRKRALLKTASGREYAAFVENQRAYEAKYRAGHRRRLAVQAEKRRNKKFKEEFGNKAFSARRMLKYEKRVQKEIKEGRRDPVTQVHDAAQDLLDEDSDCWD
ncbi:hypothetical protein B0H11DRAFT_2231560 [Mycena galericulata]|nr:hypothetical protein B0H11DRAFT_2231560 [Mycena galericulata]